MDAMLANIRENWHAYVGVLVCALPLIIIFRRRVLPALAFAIEFAIYSACIHGALWTVIRLARWFSMSTQPTYSRGQLGGQMGPIDPGWSVPIPDFWHFSLYNPPAIKYVELGILIIILALMAKYRPMKTQPVLPRKEPLVKGMSKGFTSKGFTSKGFTSKGRR